MDADDSDHGPVALPTVAEVLAADEKLKLNAALPGGTLFFCIVRLVSVDADGKGIAGSRLAWMRHMPPTDRLQVLTILRRELDKEEVEARKATS